MTRAIKIFWKIFLIGFLVVVLLITLISFGLFGKMPSLAQLENPSITLASEVFGDDGTLLGKYYKEKGNRSFVQYKDISKHVVEALVATEDERFYDHSGIDARGLKMNGFTITRVSMPADWPAPFYLWVKKGVAVPLRNSWR
jgi:penicillin-binding protein 1A